jgi:hypothetical protein
VDAGHEIVAHGVYDEIITTLDQDTERRLLGRDRPAHRQPGLYNINNGDLFRWEEMWPKLADYFEVAVAPGLPMSLTTLMADKALVWNEIVARNDLAPTPYPDAASWAFGDAVFSWDYDLIADGSKARRQGFHEYIDSAAMFVRIFDDMRERKIIPRRHA